MARDPEFFVLKAPYGWLPESESNILGAVVPNPWAPTDAFCPDDPSIYNDNPPLEMPFEDFILRKDALTSNSNEVTVNKLGKLRWARSEGPKLELQGKVVYVRRLKQHLDFWKTMIEVDDDCREKVTEWVNERHRLRRKYQVCLIVGLLICQDVVVAASDEEK